MCTTTRPHRRIAVLLLTAVTIGLLLWIGMNAHAEEEPGYIKYAEFNVPYAALRRAMEDDVACQGEVSWLDTLAYLSAKYGGEWKRYQARDLDALLEKLHNGEKIEDLTKDMKYFRYFRQVYGAVLGGFLGNYLIETGEGEWEARYGLRVFSPIAQGYWYNDFDDFGASRSYGFKRQHMGHDLMGSVGSPVIAVESGTVEAMGWNQYGGWRIGIRSRDGKRYWYYAHLRKDHPFHPSLYEGAQVTAGQVVGYLGQTGYSSRENVNGIETPHLHYGLELVFNEKQKESNNEIWVDLYALTRLLSQNKSEVERVEKDYYRVKEFLLCAD